MLRPSSSLLFLAFIQLVGCELDVLQAVGPPTGSSLEPIAWSKSLGDSTQAATAVAYDSEANLLVSGMFHGTIDFGGGPQASPSPWSPFVTKYRPDGTSAWTLGFSGWTQNTDGDVPGVQLAIGPDDSVAIAGTYHGPLDLGQGPLSSFDESSFDLFVAKFDRNGAPEWTRGLSGDGYQGPSAIVADAAGNLWVAGTFTGTIDLDGTTLVAAGTDIFLLKLDRQGHKIHAARYGGATHQYARALALTPDQGVVLVGGLSGEIDFGPAGKVRATHAEDGFLLTVDPEGRPQWSSRFGEAHATYLSAVATDSQGDIIFSGAGRSRPSLVRTATDAVGPWKIVGKLRADGALLWVRSFADEPVDEITEKVLTVDDKDEIHLATSQALEPNRPQVILRTMTSTGAVVDTKRFDSRINVIGTALSERAFALCGKSLNQPLSLGVPESSEHGSFFIAQRLR